MASSFFVNRLLVASTTRRSPLFVVPRFHRPTTCLASTSSRRAFANRAISRFSFENYRYKAKKLFSDFVSRVSPFRNFEKILDITPHTICVTHDGVLEARGDIYNVLCISINFPGIEEIKETDEELCVILDTGMGNKLKDFTLRQGSPNIWTWYDGENYDGPVLTITVRDHNEHKQGVFVSGRINLPAGLNDAKKKTETTKDGLLIIRFSKVEKIETKDIYFY